MEALEATEELLGGPVGADLVAVGLPAGTPGDEQRHGRQGQQGGRGGPRHAVAGPAGEEGEREKLAEP